MEDRRELFGGYIHIGGVAAASRSKNNWYWTDNNERVSYELPWQNGQPDFYNNDEWCLSLATGDGFKFNDIDCYGRSKERFICESVRDLNAEIDVKEGIIKVVDIEFE